MTATRPHDKIMKAAVYEKFGGPIRVRHDVPLPVTPDDGVLLRVMATGVCRSDWHGWRGHDDDVRTHGLPFVPGHECSGIVVERGSRCVQHDDDDGIRVGDRVAVPFILSCGDCRYCRGSTATDGGDGGTAPPQPTICARQQQPGFTQWGSFAEYVAIPRADRNLRRLPAHVTFVQAAALGCRFTTAYRALYQQGQWRAGRSVAVFGCGGLGLSCIMLAATANRRKGTHPVIIVAIDVSSAALVQAQTLGATHTVHVRSDQSPADVAARVRRMCAADDGVDVTLDAAGSVATSEAAVYATRPGGRMVQVGLPHAAPAIPMSRIAGREITVVGSHGFDAADLPDLLDLVNNGTVDPRRLVHAEVTLEEGCRALEAMDRESPLGMVMITKFNDDNNNNSNLPRKSRL